MSSRSSERKSTGWGGLTTDQAKTLVRKWSGRHFEDSATVRRVIEECGYHPLALTICGAMARDGIKWFDILEALGESDLRFLKRIDRVLQVSVDFLALSEPHGPKRYRELAVFRKDAPIPEALVIDWWCRDGSLQKRDARKLLATLDRKALLRLKGDTPQRKVVLHDLQHDYIRMKVESDGETG